jgi:hypothetical protein
MEVGPPLFDKDGYPRAHRIPIFSIGSIASSLSRIRPGLIWKPSRSCFAEGWLWNTTIILQVGHNGKKVDPVAVEFSPQHSQHGFLYLIK